MCKDLKKLYNLVSKNYQYQTHNHKKIYKNVNHLLDDAEFIHPKIRSNIDKNFNNTYYIDSENNHFWIVTDKKTINKNLVNQLVNRVNTMKKISKNGIDNNIYIWLTNEKKILPKKGDTLNTLHVNSGLSYVYPPKVKKNGDIYIWRKEELPKVLIHELLHSLRYDYYSQNDYLNNLIHQDFNVTHHINVNESYTETLATVLNCLFYTIEHDKDYEYFLALLSNEIEHSNQQVDKLLHHYGYHDITELSRGNSDTIFRQETGAFSYYILKAMVMNNLDNFMKFSMKNRLYYPKNGDKTYHKLLKKYCKNYRPEKIRNHNRMLKMTVT